MSHGHETKILGPGPLTGLYAVDPEYKTWTLGSKVIICILISRKFGIISFAGCRICYQSLSTVILLTGI